MSNIELPDTIVQLIGVLIIVGIPSLSAALVGRNGPKKTEAGTSAIETVALAMSNEVAKVRGEFQAELAKRDDRIAALEVSQEQHANYAKWLVSLGLPKPPFLTIDEYLAEYGGTD